MIQKERYVVTGMDQDTAPDKRKNDTYWDAENIRIVNNGRNLSIKPLKESAILLPGALFPNSLVGFYIVGTSEINNNLYIFLTNNTGTVESPVANSESYLIEVHPDLSVRIVASNVTPPTGAQFTESTDWICPQGLTSITVECYGGGSGGYLAFGGNYSRDTISVTPGNVYHIEIGAGGIGIDTPSREGKDTWFATQAGSVLVRARGGQPVWYGNPNIGATTYAGGSADTDAGGGCAGNSGNANYHIAGTDTNGVAGNGGAHGFDEFDIDGDDGELYGGAGGSGIADPYPPHNVGNNGNGAQGIMIMSYNTSADVAITDSFILSTQSPVEIVANYENEDIIKLYWTDGVSVLKTINVVSPKPQIEIVQVIDLNGITVTLQSGGSLIAGNIQYAYSLYNLNGSESVISPFSKMLSISENMKGFASGESSGLSIEVSITIDTDFEYIKLYSIHYQELNQTPKITLVAEERIISSNFIYIDDGNSGIAELSTSEFYSSNGTPYVVGTLASKRNRLFIANYRVNQFNPNIDTRAFSHASNSINYRLKDSTGVVDIVRQLPDVPTNTYDCVNYDYDTYQFIASSPTVYGATGVNIQIEQYAKIITYDVDAFNYQSLKRGEIYRFGIIFYNKYGQSSPVKWICDLKIRYFSPSRLIVPRIKLTATGVTNCLAEGCTSYQLVMVERKQQDKTILAQGFLTPVFRYVLRADGTPIDGLYYPSPLAMDYNTGFTAGLNMEIAHYDGVDWDAQNIIIPEKEPLLYCFHSSDTIFEEDLPSVESIMCVKAGYQTSTDNNDTINIWLRDGAVYHSEYWNSLKLNPLYPNLHLFEVNLGSANIDVFNITYQRNYFAGDSGPVINTADQEVTLASPSMFIRAGETKVFNVNYTFSNYIDKSNLMDTGGGQTRGYKSKYSSCILLHFDSATWHKISAPAANWSRFSTNYDGTRRIPVVDLKRTVLNQYGGSSYEAKQRNEYLKLGNIQTIDDTLNEEIIGDIFVGPLSVNRADSENVQTDDYWSLNEFIRIGWMENTHNVFGRRDNMEEWHNGLTLITPYRYYRISDNHLLLSAYNQKSDLIKAISEPFNYNAVNYFPNVVQASKVKYPNETIDNWLKFPVNENKALEGVFGKINKLYNFKGEVFAFQDKGIAVLSINPRIQTQATDGVNIELGIGAVLYDHQYLTTVAGCQDKFTIVDDGKMLFYYDRTNNTLNAVEDDKVSTVLGIRAILEANSNYGIRYATYHRYLDEIVFTFPGYSIIYSTIIKKFVCKLVYEDYMIEKHIPFGNKLLHLRPDVGIYANYEGNGFLPSKITYLLNPNPVYEKVFHNLEYRLKGQDFTMVQVSDDLNVSGFVTPEIFNKFDIHRMHLPRKQLSNDRWRGYYIFVNLYNTGSFSLDDLVLMYNIKG